ncbi:hypothetical protein OC834_006414 [Tilletia horrida]|nr:hypothetical protein OC834_006414 [Tilletia horrida]
MSLESLCEHMRSFGFRDAAAAPAAVDVDVDVEALAEELEALAAIFTSDHEDSNGDADAPAGWSADNAADADELTQGSGAFHILQIDGAETASLSSLGSEQVDPSGSDNIVSRWHPGSRLRLMLNTTFQPSADAEDGGHSSMPSVPIRLAITIPPAYPLKLDAVASKRSSAPPPQLQLLSRFIGPYAVDPKLFGAVLRTFLHYDPHTEAAQSGDGRTLDSELASSPSDERPLVARFDAMLRSKDEGVRWSPGDPVLYEGIEYVRELVTEWYESRRRLDRQRAHARQATGPEAVRASSDANAARRPIGQPDGPGNTTVFSAPDSPALSKERNKILQRLVRTEAVVERKSVFIAHAARLDHPDEVPIVLAHILSDRKIARATHPIINAWICTMPGDKYKASDPGAVSTVHRDHDDDGETAAGGRLAHLLDLLNVPNAIVVVTRWYGGILLGADRFKFINRVARNGLELAGLVSASAGSN